MRLTTATLIVGRLQSCKLMVKRSQHKIKKLAAENRRQLAMQDFTGAKPNIDTLCVENTKLRADIEELEANNSALTAETDKLSTQNNI